MSPFYTKIAAFGLLPCSWNAQEAIKQEQNAALTNNQLGFLCTTLPGIFQVLYLNIQCASRASGGKSESEHSIDVFGTWQTGPNISNTNFSIRHLNR